MYSCIIQGVWHILGHLLLGNDWIWKQKMFLHISGHRWDQISVSVFIVYIRNTYYLVHSIN